MLTQSIEQGACWLTLALILVGCAGAPERSASTDSVQVDNRTRQQFEQALSLMKSQRYADAVPVLEKIIERDGSLTGPWLNLGIARSRLGQTDAAIEALQQAVIQDARNPAVYNELGIAYRHAGSLDSARKAYLKALDLDPQYAYAHRNLGILLDVYLQRPDEALAHYKRYQALQPAENDEAVKWIAELERRVPARASTQGVDR